MNRVKSRCDIIQRFSYYLVDQRFPVLPHDKENINEVTKWPFSQQYMIFLVHVGFLENRSKTNSTEITQEDVNKYKVTLMILSRCKQT